MTSVTVEAQEKILTVQDAAAECLVSPRTVARWITKGRIKAWRAGRAWRIPASEIDRLKTEGAS